MKIRFGEHDTGEAILGFAEAGDPAAPLIICLHGFPEYWAAWRQVMERLADDFRVVAPDQRGYNRSSRPQEVDAYRGKHLVADIASLADRLSPDRPFVLAGHDWGASVAYAFAFRHPERLSHLIIANGVHPVCFQRAILEDPAQREASRYINLLRSERAEALLSEDGYRRLLAMIAKFSKADFMDEETRAGYLDAWSQPGALTGMLNWYRAAPIVVPEPGQVADMPDMLQGGGFEVRMPHLLLWGEADEALRPSTIKGLEEFASDLTIERFTDAGHWILHEKPDEVAEAMRIFLKADPREKNRR
jgi:epoxide hydrolase 4